MGFLVWRNREQRVERILWFDVREVGGRLGLDLKEGSAREGASLMLDWFNLSSVPSSFLKLHLLCSLKGLD